MSNIWGSSLVPALGELSVGLDDWVPSYPVTLVVPPCLCQAQVFQFFVYKAQVQDLKARNNSIFQRLLKGPVHERCRKSRHIHLTSYLGTSLQTYQSSTLQGVSYYNFFFPYLEVVTDLLLNSLLKKVGARLQKNGSTSWTGGQHMLKWVHPGSVFSHCKRSPLTSYWKKSRKEKTTKNCTPCLACLSKVSQR